MVAWLARRFDIATIQAVADYFGRDASGLSRSLTNLVSRVKAQELIEVEKWIEESVCQA